MVLEFKFPLIDKVKIHLPKGSFCDFVRRQFSAYFICCQETDKCNWIVECECKQASKCYQQAVIHNYQLSRNFKIRDKMIEYGRFKYVCSGTKIYIFYNERNGRFRNCARNMKRFLLSADRTRMYEYNHKRFYTEILFPIFSIYSMMGFYLLHGSILENQKGRYTALTGLDGVGKSSLAVMLQKSGWKSCSDNFMLTNGLNYIPLNLTIRIDPGQSAGAEILYMDKNIKEMNDGNTLYKMVRLDKMYCLYICRKLEIRSIHTDFLSLLYYCNGAPEIKEANSFCSPFRNFVKQSLYETDLEMLGIPKGKLEDGCEVIIHGS